MKTASSRASSPFRPRAVCSGIISSSTMAIGLSTMATTTTASAAKGPNIPMCRRPIRSRSTIRTPIRRTGSSTPSSTRFSRTASATVPIRRDASTARRAPSSTATGTMCLITASAKARATSSITTFSAETSPASGKNCPISRNWALRPFTSTRFLKAPAITVTVRPITSASPHAGDE